MSQASAKPFQPISNPQLAFQAANLGMWIFLAQELLFFAAIFLAYAIYRNLYAEAFEVASAHLREGLGILNTAILLTSSFTMVLAVREGQHARWRGVVAYLVATFLLATAFLGVKGFEYYTDYREHLIPGPHFRLESVPAGIDVRHVQLFFVLYFVSTALHALHVIVGMGLQVWVALLAASRRQSPERYTTKLDCVGLYWHFVDIVWVFLFPLLYLIKGGGHG